MIDLMIYTKDLEGFKRTETERSECNLRNLQQKKQKNSIDTATYNGNQEK